MAGLAFDYERERERRLGLGFLFFILINGSGRSGSTRPKIQNLWSIRNLNKIKIRTRIRPYMCSQMNGSGEQIFAHP